MAIGKVLARGQLTLPREIRRSAGIDPGDLVLLTVIAPGRVELRVLPRLRLADLLERYHIQSPVDEPRDREAWEAKAAEDVLGRP